MSLITGVTSMAMQGWKLANRITGESLLVIADHGGPRCCKRDTILAMLSAARFILQHFNPAFTATETVVCQFSQLNRKCLKTECPFYAV